MAQYAYRYRSVLRQTPNGSVHPYPIGVGVEFVREPNGTDTRTVPSLPWAKRDDWFNVLLLFPVIYCIQY